MRLMRYLARFYASVLLVTLVVLVVIVVAVTLVESAGRLANADASAATALKLALFRSVQFSHQMLPVACLLGAMAAGTLLARRGELLAIQAAGVGPRRVWGAFVAVVFAAGMSGAACGEVFVPRAVAGVERIESEELRRVGALTRFYNRRTSWFREGDLILYLPAVEAASQVFHHPVVYRMVDGLVGEIIEATRMYYDGAQWWLDEPRFFDVATVQLRQQERTALPLRVTPRNLVDVTGDPRQMRAGEISDLIDRRRRAGFDATAHSIELHTRMSQPFSVFWMFLLVAPWTLSPQRRRSLAVNLGAGVLAIAVILALTHVFRLMALGHTIPSPLGAWGIGLLCVAAFPVSLWLRSRRR